MDERSTEAKKIVERLMRLDEAVTVNNAFDLTIGQELYVFLNTAKNLVLVEGTIDEVACCGIGDVLITMEFTIKGAIHRSTLELGETYNGWTNLVGGEGDNFNRVFSEKDAAIRYFENVSYLNDIKSLERATSVHGLISRLLHKANGPKSPDGDPSDEAKKKKE